MTDCPVCPLELAWVLGLDGETVAKSLDVILPGLMTAMPYGADPLLVGAIVGFYPYSYHTTLQVKTLIWIFGQAATAFHIMSSMVLPLWRAFLVH